MRILPFFLLCFYFLIFSLQTMYFICYLDLLCVGSTHLHGIRFDVFLGKRNKILFLQVPKIEDSGKKEISKIIHSYTVQFLFIEREDDSAYFRKRIIEVNHRHKDRTHISHRKIQVFESNG
jgi:hypothetical protein